MLLVTIYSFALSLLCFSKDLAEWKKQDVPIQAEGGHWVSEWVSFPIQEGVKSFQIFVHGSSETFIQVTDIQDPRGRALVNSSVVSEKPLTPYSQPILQNVKSIERSEAVVHGFQSLIVPNDPSLLPIESGSWRLRTLSHKEPKEKSVSITIHSSHGPSKRKISVAANVDPNSSWAKNRMATKKVMTKALAYLNQFAKIDLQWFGEPKALNEPPEKSLDLPLDLEIIAKKENLTDSINVYFMGEMLHQSKPVNGLACIGGPIANLHHPCFVGLFAGKNADEVSIEQKSLILAHELGHYLGLFHTRDVTYYAIGPVEDPFDDTAPLPTGKNLMDPGVHNKVPALSPKQKEMIWLHPAL